MMTKEIAAIIIDHDWSIGQLMHEHPNNACVSLIQSILAKGKISLKNYDQVDVGIGTRREFTPIDLLGIIFSAQVINNKLVSNGSAFHSFTKFIDSLKKLHPNVQRQSITINDMECSAYRGNGNYIDRHANWFGASMDELETTIANMKIEKNVTFFDWLKYHQETHQYQTDVEYRTRLLTDTWRKQLGTTHFRDDHKFFMLFIQAHAAANKHPNQSVDLIFIDDHPGFAKNFHAIVSEVPHLIPNNITFKPILYSHAMPKETRALTQYEINGQGQTTPDFLTVAGELHALNCQVGFEDIINDSRETALRKITSLRAYAESLKTLSQLGRSLFTEGHRRPNDQQTITMTGKWLLKLAFN